MKLTETSRYEIERGKPMPSKIHSFIQNNLIFQLNLNYRDKLQIFSELSLDLMSWESVPDICMYPKMQINTSQDIISMKEAPLGVIEILSPTQIFNDLLIKINRYFDAGVTSCWLVLPGVDNIYVFSTPTDYRIYKSNEILQDEQLQIHLTLKEIFE